MIVDLDITTHFIIHIIRMKIMDISLFLSLSLSRSLSFSLSLSSNPPLLFSHITIYTHLLAPCPLPLCIIYLSAAKYHLQ